MCQARSRICYGELVRTPCPQKLIWYVDKLSQMLFVRALFEKEQRAGIGVIIRNHAGLVLASLTQQIPLPATAIEVEALAAR
uniref:Uncharacterized protein n=1 Tax=Quercus lobata TaxID=97700 RepID=A0A7N2L3V4_QUELO